MNRSVVFDCRGILESNVWDQTVDFFQALGEPEKRQVKDPVAALSRQKVAVGQN
jgi:hypothetical protein